MKAISKKFSEEELLKVVESWRKKGEKIVFTNGCFDVFHYGHLCLLQKAKSFGTKLIVGLNSDDSVTKLKGESRPINLQQHRAALLEALEMIDAVSIFEEETPELLITKIKPEVLVKGGDYKVSQIAGAKFVLSNGGEVKIVPLVDGFSSSKILELLNRE